MTNPIKCPACDGRGSHPGSAPRMRVKCKGCGATGLLWLPTPGAALAELLRAVSIAPQRMYPDVYPLPIVPIMPMPFPLPFPPATPTIGPWQPNPGPFWVGPGTFSGDRTTGCAPAPFLTPRIQS